MQGIPSFIDTRSLTITRACRVPNDQEKIRTEVEANDAQGDTLVIARESDDVGNTMMMPHVSMSVRYAEKASGSVVEHASIGSDESYDLWSSLRDAERADGVQSGQLGWILAELASQGGGGGGAC